MGVKGFKHSEESKIKIGKANTGKHHSEETKRKIADGNKGKMVSEETRKKLSETLKGYEKSEEHKRKINDARKGKYPSEETKRKMRESRIGFRHTEETKAKMRQAQVGEKSHCFGKTGKDSPTWNPNLTDEDRADKRNYPAYKEWLKLIYEKDSYTCQKCGDNKGGNLEAHHIEDYANNAGLRTTASNGITFCKPCHKDFHRVYGRRSNIEKVKEFLNMGSI